MNYFLLAAGIISAFAVVGHFAIGYKDFMKPVLDSKVERIPVKVMHSLFHYMSVFMAISTVILLAFAFGVDLGFQSMRDVKLLIGVIYAGFALSQFLIAANSKIKGGLFKMFQWIFWLLIALFTLIA